MLHAAPNQIDRSVLHDRLLDLWERTGDLSLHRLADGEPPVDGATMATEQDRSDWLTTCLMNSYKNTGDATVFALLFELSRGSFLQAIHSRLRRGHSHVDVQDVLQEVFLNIYRYPHKFHADRADAFRNWGHRIVRNTLLKFLKGETRCAHFLTIDEELQQPVDTHARSPERVAAEAESASLVNTAYLLYLNLYLLHFQRLSPKEQHALTLVEIEGGSYRDAAARLGIRLENLKMVIFRGRRKIFRGMETSLGRMGAGQGLEAS
ncbi:MAG TPA: RNA polymerase sigma factor [Planctomycetota bacterium]|nr:RNA polymerase sigma factor [Planctomycetota bacterium]